MPILTPIQVRIFEKLLSGQVRRKDLVEILKMPRTTIYDNLVKLQKHKLAKKHSRNNGLRGRPIVYWSIPKRTLEKIKDIKK